MDKEKLIEGYIVTDLTSGNFQDFITKIKMMNLTPEEIAAMQLFGDAEVSKLLADVITAINAGTPYDEPVTKLFNYVKTITKTNFSVDDLLGGNDFVDKSAELIAKKNTPNTDLSMTALSARIDSMSETIAKMADVIEGLAYNYKIALDNKEITDEKLNMLQSNIGKATFVLGKLIEGTTAPVNMSEDDYDFSDEEEFDDEFDEGSLPAGTSLTDINEPEVTEEVTVENTDEAKAYEDGVKDGVEAALNASEMVEDEFSEEDFSEDGELDFSDDELNQLANYLDFSDDENPEDYFNEDGEFSDEEAVDALDQIFSDEDFGDDDKSKAWYDGYNTAEKDEYKGDATTRPEELATKFGYETGSTEYTDFINGYKEGLDKNVEDKSAEGEVDKTGSGDAPTSDSCDHSYSFSESDASERYKNLQLYFASNG